MKRILIILLVLLLAGTITAVFAGGKKEVEPAVEAKPFAGQTITCLYFSATYNMIKDNIKANISEYNTKY